MKRVSIAVISTVIVLSAAALLSIGFYLNDWLQTPVSVATPHKVFTVEKGETLTGVAQRLQQQDLLKWPRLWTSYARFTEKTSIKAGEYALGETESPVSLLTLFISGASIQHSITFVEGTTFRDMLKRLNAHPKVEKTLTHKNTITALHAFGLVDENPEGWFFPDTYAFLATDTDAIILERAYKKMQSVLNEEWQQRAKALPYKTPYDALIMASIIEKETGAPHERDEIAGVFVRRLQKGMRLQTDPTVIYGMGDLYTGNITRKDLKTPTPYNTYTINGLPPTPIALAGREAIHAALNPKAGEALYFVAKGDGTHYFSATLEEHINAVKKFQKRRNSEYRSNYKPD